MTDWWRWWRRWRRVKRDRTSDRPSAHCRVGIILLLLFRLGYIFLYYLSVFASRALMPTNTYIILFVSVSNTHIYMCYYRWQMIFYIRRIENDSDETKKKKDSKEFGRLYFLPCTITFCFFPRSYLFVILLYTWPSLDGSLAQQRRYYYMYLPPT